MAPVPEPAQHRTGIIAAAAVGVVAGALSGLFGIGGGTVIVPGLVLISRMDQRLAHGTSLAAIVPIAISGVVGYGLDDKVDWAVAACLAVGAVIGARIGTRLLHVVSQHRLRMAFAVLLLITAVRMVLDSTSAGLGRDDLDVSALVGLGVLGLAAGITAGLLGVGGGIVMVPGQVLLFGIADAVAKGTSLAVIIPTAVVGTWSNVQRGNADLRAAAAVGLAGVATAFAASRVAVDLDPTVSAVLFALLLALVSLRMLLQRPDDEAEAT